MIKFLALLLIGAAACFLMTAYVPEWWKQTAFVAPVVNMNVSYAVVGLCAVVGLFAWKLKS